MTDQDRFCGRMNCRETPIGQFDTPKNGIRALCADHAHGEQVASFEVVA